MTSAGGMNRHLLRPQPSGIIGPSGGAAPPSASSDLVGLVPEAVHEALLLNAAGNTSASGQIDGVTGLACLVLPSNLAEVAGEFLGAGAGAGTGTVDIIHIWRHRTQTTSEELCAPDRSASFVHPEQAELAADYNSNAASNAIDGSKLVSLVPYGQQSAVTVSAPTFASPQQRRSSAGAATAAPLSSLYVCTPSGTLAYWIDALPRAASGRSTASAAAAPSDQCDSAVRLALDEGEVVTCISSTATARPAATAGGGSGNSLAAVPPSEPLVLVGTSSGRLMVSVRIARPLSLRARELKRMAAPMAFGSSAAAGGGGGGQGLIATAFSAAAYLMTPGKTRRGAGAIGTDSLLSASGSTFGVGSAAGICDIIPLPHSSWSYSEYLPSRPGSPSPTKTRRLSVEDAVASSAVRFLVLSDDLMLTKWRLSGNDPGGSAAGSGDLREGIEWEVSLSQIVTKRLDDIASSGSSYIAETKAVRAAVSADGRCIAVIFLAQLQSSEVRAYGLSVSLEKVCAGAAVDDATAGPIWLNRHPSDLLSSGRWLCGGMSVVPSAVGYVMYSAWHDPQAAALDEVASAEQGGAVATTVLLPTTGGAASMSGGVKMCDTDMPPHVLPALLSGMVSPDLLSGGVCIAGSTGCVADLRVAFPIPARGVRTAGVVDEAEVQSVAAHLLSAFLSHAKALAADGDDASRQVAHGTIPPSIFAARPDVLGPAVLNALHRLLLIRSSPHGLHQSRQQKSQRDVFVSEGHSDAAATISFLNNHCEETLPSFVNFLIHAGIYLRVEAEHRVKLRDVGEKMAAALALVDRWREELTLADSNDATSNTLDEFALNHVSSAINSMLCAGSVAVAERLPGLLADLQRDILGLSIATSSGASSVMLLGVTSALLCQAHTCALRFRSDTSEDLFKLPLDDTISSMATCAPWTSEKELLNVYEGQLQKLKAASSSSAPNRGGSRDEVHVQVLSSALLDGYRDALDNSSSTDNALISSYHAAKILAIPLLRLYDPSDVWPFDLSVDHGYFDGVFDITFDWTLGERRFQEQLGAEEKQEQEWERSFDLKPILEACAAVASGEEAQSAYKYLLPPSIDPPTGLTFPHYVFKRYVDLGLQGVALDLGRLCPSHLAVFVEEDGRMADHRWIIRVRSNRHGSARDGLIDVVKDGFGGQTVADRELTLSLAKLCNGLEASSSVSAMKEKGQTIEDGLTLVSVQRLLYEQGLRSSTNTDVDDERPLRPTELLNLVREGVTESARSDAEGSIRLCLAGLAVAEVAGRGEDEFVGVATASHSVARYAAPVWSLAIMSDAELWQSLAAEYAAGASGELGARDDFEAVVETTVFYGVLRSYMDGRQDGEERGFDDKSLEVSVGFYNNADIIASVMDELRAANAANDANAKSLETVLCAAAAAVLG